jgi:hypothetical protein
MMMWSNHRFIVLECYIDESETKSTQDPAVCVAGYMAQGKTWKRFAKDWNKALDLAPKHVETFHATDFAGKRKSKDGNFHGWTMQQRAAFIVRLIDLVKSYKLKEFGVAIHRSTYKQVLTGNRGYLHGDLTLVAAKIAMLNAAAWAMYRNWKYAPSFYVERGSKYFDALREAHHALCNIADDEFQRFFSKSTITELPRCREHPQTQPADMLAFYCSQWVSRLIGYDPAKEAPASYMRRVKPLMPPELARLLGPYHFMEYQTPKTLDHNLKVLEGKVRYEAENE